MVTSRGFALIFTTTILLAWPTAAAFGNVKPGDVITADNQAQIKDMVSPGVLYKIQNGMSLKIVPTERLDWPPPFREATEKYSGQVRLSRDRRSMVGYVAGQPFPLIDANDPDAATKIMWNNQFRPVLGDDYDLRFFECESNYNGRNAPHHPFFDVMLGHYAGYNMVNRTEVEPQPVD